MSLLPFVETFSAIVEKGSFTAAAEALNISKPVVSKQLTQLEKRLGVQLIQRTTRRLHLTEAGELFAGYAARILAEAREAEETLGEMQHEPRGRLRISVPESLALSLLPVALADYQIACPEVELDVSVSGRLVDLVDEGLDLVLRIGELQDSSLIARLLMRSRVVTCAAPAYLERRGTPMAPDDLRQHDCLVYGKRSRAGLWSYQVGNDTHVDVKVNGNFQSDSGSLLIHATLMGRGIFRGTEFVVKDAVREGRLKLILDEFAHAPTGLYAVYPHSRHVSAKVRSFVDFLVDAWLE